jgi:hypothetical protein
MRKGGAVGETSSEEAEVSGAIGRLGQRAHAEQTRLEGDHAQGRSFERWVGRTQVAAETSFSI